MEKQDYKVGDVVVITSAPSRWASLINSNNPMRANIYPYVAEIKAIEDAKDYRGAEIGDYGWDLDVLIREQKIQIYDSSPLIFN